MATDFKLWRLIWICTMLISTIIGNGASVDLDVTTASSETDDDYSDSDLADEIQDLQLDEELHDQHLQSSDKLQLRCRVSVFPKKNLTFTWYHDNNLMNPKTDNRISIKTRVWGSRLQILNVYSTDGGLYRCEASDGEKSVHTQATLEVSFNKPPPSDADDLDSNAFKGKCERYTGQTCAKYLRNKYVYLESFQKQEEIDATLGDVLKLIGNEEHVPKSCAKYASPAFCHYVFPLCDTESDIRDDPVAIKLCREDCELLQYDVCAEAFQSPMQSIRDVRNSTKCENLPPTTTREPKCSRVGLERVVDRTHSCYNGTGESYKGVAAVAEDGRSCKPWPGNMLQEYPFLSGGHNFCRNPGNAMDKPWCFVDRNRINKVACQVQQCTLPVASTDLLVIIVPCLGVLLLIGCIVVAVCVARRKKQPGKQYTPGKKMEMATVDSKKNVIPTLPAAMVHFSVELGEGKYGKVYKAQIMNNLTYSPTEPVAAKTVIAGALPSQINDFHREMDMYADLQHLNVSCLKACVLQPTLRCMIFEYTSRVDLHELLTLHSPHSDIGGKMSGSVSSHTSASLEEGDFLHMSVQVAGGLEYLATQNFIHRDLAARNILVCSNNVMKISNLGVVRDCYLSSYYRSPQGGHMLPVRWMAPESLTANMYSEKSVVWSFGVMVWEMFSYGLQPYCGYSNHEVIDMISNGQTLSCPDQCSSRVYSLLRECWSNDPNKRPTCKELHAKLSGWEGASSTRMTSQLAQGIHRQLNSVIHEGQQFQYAPPQGTVIDGFGQPYIARQPDPHYSSPSPASSGMASHAPPQYPGYAQQPAYPHAQMYQPQQQQQVHYARPPPSSYPSRQSHTHSSRSTDSGGSSVRNQMHNGYRNQTRSSNTQIYPNTPQPQYHQQHAEYEPAHGTPDSGVHSSKGVMQPQSINHNHDYHPESSGSPVPPPVGQRSRPGSEFVNTGLEPMRKLSNNGKPAVAPKPPLSPYTSDRARVAGNQGPVSHNHIDTVARGEMHNEGESQGRKGTSCDSGLPTEDGETDSGENQPFLSAPAPRGYAPNKMLQISGSMSSTVSGSTAATAESRLTA